MKTISRKVRSVSLRARRACFGNDLVDRPARLQNEHALYEPVASQALRSVAWEQHAIESADLQIGMVSEKQEAVVADLLAIQARARNQVSLREQSLAAMCPVAPRAPPVVTGPAIFRNRRRGIAGDTAIATSLTAQEAQGRFPNQARQDQCRNDAAIAANLSEDSAVIGVPLSNGIRKAKRSHSIANHACRNDAAIAASLADEAVLTGSPVVNGIRGRWKRPHAATDACRNDAAIAASLAEQPVVRGRLVANCSPGNAKRAPLTANDVTSDAAIAACLAGVEVPASDDAVAPSPRPHRADAPRASSTTEVMHCHEVPGDAAIAACLEALDLGVFGPSAQPPSIPPEGSDAMLHALTSSDVTVGDDSKASADLCEPAGDNGSLELPDQGIDAGSSTPDLTEDECVVCLDLQPGVSLVPCGHVCLCVSCAGKLGQSKECPLCRTPIEQIVPC